ncbi:phage tail tape measure protein [Dysgonomonas termitidis]|uniref:Phage tail tape measure protein n=1 Tax=Dysgonomonas termitidis TaxID=1516126 RepID=A0ABV9KRR4_9BACT
MAQEQNYQVNYTINVEASEGTKQVMAFAESVNKLNQAKTSFATAMENINTFMKDVDKAFRPKGRKRDYSFRFDIKTGDTDKKLAKVKEQLLEIKELAKGITLAVNTDKPLNTKAIKSQVKAPVQQPPASTPNAKIAAQSITETQQKITKAVGKVNAALISLEKGREVRIKTDAATTKLQQLLSLMDKIKGASAMNMALSVPGINHGRNIVPYAPEAFRLSDKADTRLREKLYARRQLHDQRMAFQQQQDEAKTQAKARQENARRAEKEQASLLRQQEEMRKKALIRQQQAEKETEKHRRRNAADALRHMQRQAGIENSLYGGKRRAAINRLQYSKAPTLRNMPFAYMLNGYMMYGMMRRELADAVEYSNIMQTAHSILRVADTDLGTFETRFDSMARYVRQIGIETKFTAIEVAGAVKYLSMAGMGIDTINKSIRPIANLALIGDNDISQIADLATNIMAGYDIRNSSMDSVADILASTVSRSNVNIVEMAESYKMAAGYLKMAGVDFSESAAAIGILGNMGVKGTMAGTSLRAMATRFAKPTKESQKTMDRLGVKFTGYKDIYGKQVEQLRPLADIFQELEQKGATMADMQAIFGKIGGNAAMMFLKNSDQLRALTAQNITSHGISEELAKVKQDTTKGLWYQATSGFSESFMQGFEILEPQIRSLLRDFLSKFNAPEFARGLASIGRSLMDILSVIGNIATFITKNFTWIEPLLFSGLVATRLFRLAGSLTNVGVALGFIGKQSLASSSMQAISGLVGLGVGPIGRGMSMANKRALVTAMSAAGISGKGAMTHALAQSGMLGASALLARGGAAGLFANQVAMGNGLVGAGASIAAIGTGAVAATAGIAGLVGIMGYLAYKTWKVKEAKDAVQEEINANRKYHYPSIETLHKALRDTYNQAISTKQAVDDVTAGKTIEEVSGQKIGAFTGNWWTAVLNTLGQGANRGYNPYASQYAYTQADARNDDTKAALETIAKKDGQNRLNAAWGDIGKLKTPVEVGAFIQTIESKYGHPESALDKSLWTEHNGVITYKKGMGELPASDAARTYHYARYQNDTIIPIIKTAAQTYLDAIQSRKGAREFMRKSGYDFANLLLKGFYQDANGEWAEKVLKKNATDKQREDQLANKMEIHDRLTKFAASMRTVLGNNPEAAENILKAAGFPRWMYSNEPDYNDPAPFNANGITNSGHGGTDADDGMAGGNYSGTGKLSSAAPKQVIVNIASLLSVETIDLLKTQEGQTVEIQNLKEQLAQALIDVVHDFDASWNG